MTDRISDLDTLAERIGTSPTRRLVALAGPPASGKSTLADLLAHRVDGAVVVPMDGFHLDNRVLEPRGLMSRKGAPETFDARGFLRLVAALRDGAEVIYPLFDRSRDTAIAGAGVCPAEATTVILEGNYLLYDAPVWRDLGPLWDMSVQIEVPRATLQDRLVRRWLDHGLDPAAAEARALGNDMVNVDLVAGHSLPADIAYLGNS